MANTNTEFEHNLQSSSGSQALHAMHKLSILHIIIWYCLQ